MKSVRLKQAQTFLLLSAVLLCVYTFDPKVGTLKAQASIESALAQFDVASVRPNKSGDGPFVIVGLSNQIRTLNGRFTATNVTVQLLIQSAYQMPLVRVVGGPAWLASERFDIAAKAPDHSSPAVMRSMVRGLLSERFRLRVHTQKRESSVYTLTMARRDGRLGPRLRQSDSDCIAAANSPSLATPTIPNPNAPAPCGNGGGRPGFIRGRGLALSYLAFSLTQSVGRVVIDQTNLTGYYDYELQWTPEGPSDARSDTPNAGTGASLFTALQEQLGLQLNSGHAPIDVLVIDRAEKPSPN